MNDKLKKFIGWNFQFAVKEKILDIEYKDNSIYIITDSSIYKMYGEYDDITFEDLKLFVNSKKKSIIIDPNWKNIWNLKWVYRGDLTNKYLAIKECE